MIIFSMDGYDEISLTSDFKYIHNGAENISSPEQMGFKRALQSELSGGKTVEESAMLFMKVLKGEGTETQNNVVTVNSQMALSCYFPGKTVEECRQLASESLLSGRALKAFKSLMEMQP